MPVVYGPEMDEIYRSSRIAPPDNRVAGRKLGYGSRMARAKGTKVDGLAAHCTELFELLGGVTRKLVFGEHAFFHDGVMFALIWEGVVYVRVDRETRARHEALGLKPFVYKNRDGKATSMPYFEVPSAAFEDPEEMAEWARPAIRAAHVASLEKKVRAKRPPTKKAATNASKSSAASRSRRQTASK